MFLCNQLLMSWVGVEDDTNISRWQSAFSFKNLGLRFMVICQTPPLARFQLNNSNIPFPRIPLGGQHTPAKPGEIRLLGQCLHLGYIRDFFIIRGVPEYSITRREYCHQWQLNQELWMTSLSRSQRSAPSNKMLHWKTYVLILCCS